jgi:hypothetical protein
MRFCCRQPGPGRGWPRNGVTEDDEAYDCVARRLGEDGEAGPDAVGVIRQVEGVAEFWGPIRAGHDQAGANIRS